MQDALIGRRIEKVCRKQSTRLLLQRRVFFTTFIHLPAVATFTIHTSSTSRLRHRTHSPPPSKSQSGGKWSPNKRVPPPLRLVVPSSCPDFSLVWRKEATALIVVQPQPGSAIFLCEHWLAGFFGVIFLGAVQSSGSVIGTSGESKKC